MHGRHWLGALTTVALFGVLISPRATAAPRWLSGGFPVAPLDSIQADPVVAPDGAGGVFIAWQDYRSGLGLYAQHLTSEGAPAPGWPSGGLMVSPRAWDPAIVPDGQGGVFVSGANQYEAGVWHLTANGSITSAPAMVRSETSADARDRRPAEPADTQKREPASFLTALLPDDHGGVFMAWEDGYTYGIYVVVERLTWTGGPAFPAVRVRDGHQYAPVLCSDGADGVIVAWTSYGASKRDIKATRLGPDGARIQNWPDTCVTVCSAPEDQDALGIVPDGAGGAIVIWQDSRNGSHEQVYAQRIASDGTVAAGWPIDGRPVYTLPSAPGLTRSPGWRRGEQRYSSVMSDGAGGALIAWTATMSDGGDIYAQHLLPDGTVASGWPENGLRLCAAPGVQKAPSLAADGQGGMFVTWQDGRSAAGVGVYALHVTGAGAIASGWPADGLAVCGMPYDHLIPRAVPDGSGGAIVAWQDLRCPGDGSMQQIFASTIAADGALPTAPGITISAASVVGSSAEAGTVRLTWQTTDVAGLAAIVYRRDVDGPWKQLTNVLPDAAGLVTHVDGDAVAGCRYEYGLGLTNCGVERIMGRTSIDIPYNAEFRVLSAGLVSVQKESGRLRIAWRLNGADSFRAALFRRDSCSDWIQVDTTVADPSAMVVLNDKNLFEGHRYAYRLRVHACGQDVDLGETWTTIPLGKGFIPTTTSLIESTVVNRVVHLVWTRSSGPPSIGRVYRQDSTGTWALCFQTSSASLSDISFSDSQVSPGGHYVYRLTLQACEAVTTFGPTVVDVARWLRRAGLVPGAPIPPEPPEPANPADAPSPRGPATINLAIRVASPAHGELAVRFELATDHPATIDVFDTGGRRLISRDVSLGQGEHEVLLAEASALRPGLYVIRLSQHGHTRTARIVLLP